MSPAKNRIWRWTTEELAQAVARLPAAPQAFRSDAIFDAAQHVADGRWRGPGLLAALRRAGLIRSVPNKQYVRTGPTV